MKHLVLLVCAAGIAICSRSQDLGQLGKGKAFDKGGSLGVGCMFTAQQGISARRVPFSWYLNGSPTLKFYDVTIPFTFVWSEQERSFSQPFNKYGASPYYKWATIHAGWRNLSYSDYTLSGATFLGGGFDLNPGNLRVGALYGKFHNRVAVDGESRSRYSYLLPAYERWGFAAKIGLGKGPNFTDLILFKGWDKQDAAVEASADSAGIRPMENVALGLKSNYTIAKHVDVNLDLGASVVTNDTRLSDSAFSDPQLAGVSKVLKVNMSTVPYFAATTSVGYSLPKVKLRAEYKRVDPNYQSMGNYYIPNDLVQYTLSPVFMLFRNKLIINGSYGFRKNNLLKEQFNTTLNRIGSLFVTISPSPVFGVSLNYSNYGTNLSSGQTELNDSILYSIVNQSAGGNIRFTKTRADVTNSFVFSGQYQALNDNNVVTKKFSESQTITGSFSYNHGRGKKGINTGSNLNFTQVSVYNKTFQLLGPAFNLRMQFKKARLNWSANTSVQLKFSNSKNEGSIVNVGSSLTWAPTKKHNFSISGNATFNSTTNVSVYSYNEQRLSIRYNYQL